MNRFFEDLTKRYEMPCLEGFPANATTSQAIYLEESGRELRDLDVVRDVRRAAVRIVSIRTTLRSVAYGDAEQPRTSTT